MSDKETGQKEYIINLTFGKKKYMPTDSVKELMQHVLPFCDVSMHQKVQYIESISDDYNEQNDFTLFYDYVRELCFFYVKDEAAQSFVMTVMKGRMPCLYFSEIEDKEEMLALFFRAQDEVMKRGFKEVDICFKREKIYHTVKAFFNDRIKTVKR